MREVFAHLRTKWKRVLTGGPELDPRDSGTATYLSKIGAVAKAHWNALEKSRARDCLWRDLAGTDGSQLVTIAYIRIKEMALAYVLPGSGLERNHALKLAILGALRWMYEHRYYDGLKPYSNWWHWQIGAPLALNDAVLLLFDDLSEGDIADYMRAIDHFAPQPVAGNATGANRIWLCLVAAVRSIILEDGKGLQNARDAISPVFPFVKSGDGFYEDGSFIQHSRYAYTGSYGRSMLLDISRLLYLLDSTQWEVIDPLKDNVFSWIVAGFEPVMYKGALMDMTRGREISRFYSQDHDSGHHVIESVMRLSHLAPREYAERLRGMAKHWILADTYMPITQYETVPFGMATSAEKITLARELLAADHIQARPSYNKFAMFACMDRAALHRSGFAVGISMFSSRICNFESINGENYRGWYTAHGMTYLYNNDLGQFCDAFWPTVDAHRLPGTTVAKAPMANSFGRHRTSSKSWVGGVGLLDTYGAVGMELEDYRQDQEVVPLTAKKSWFLFDREVVALGSNVRAELPFTVETIVENRKLNENGDNALVVNGCVKQVMLGWAEELPETAWMHLAGSVAGADIGYYFPGRPTLHALREARTGKWRDIGNGEGNHTSGSEEMTKNYLTVWFDHGVRPQQETYGYVLLPGMTSAKVEQYAQHPRIEIVEQSAEAHAVHHSELNMWGANFWTDAPVTVGPIASSGKAVVMLKAGEHEIDIAVSDPTQLNQGEIRLEILLEAKAIISADPEITVEELSPIIKLSAAVKDAMGKTLQIKLQR